MQIKIVFFVFNILCMSKPEVESRTQGSRPRTKKSSRPWTGMLETKDTGVSVLQKKGLQNFFLGDLQKRKTKKRIRKFSARFLAFSYII